MRREPPGKSLRNCTRFHGIASNSRRGWAMAQFSYDVVPYNDGWAIVVTPARLNTFPTRLSAFDTAVEFARKLRFVGFSVNIRMHDGGVEEHEPRKRRVG
jgi:hypothetical protein